MIGFESGWNEMIDWSVVPGGKDEDGVLRHGKCGLDVRYVRCLMPRKHIYSSWLDGVPAS